jgi:hypothetical protein
VASRLQGGAVTSGAGAVARGVCLRSVWWWLCVQMEWAVHGRVVVWSTGVGCAWACLLQLLSPPPCSCCPSE